MASMLRPPTSAVPTGSSAGLSGISTSDLPPISGSVDRHVLNAESELRLEVPHSRSASTSSYNQTCTITLQKGSCELWGTELALHRPYVLTGGAKLALFTWHGCVVDVDCDNLEISYTSEETNANVAFVNTHAQLEALRDEALASQTEGPRVLILGPTESGKTSLAKVLVAYATKLGRSPLFVDLDPSDNALSVPGTLAVAPMTIGAISVETYAGSGLPPSTAAPLVMWYSSTSLNNTDLFKAQVTAIANKIDKRLEGDVDARASGLIVNTNGWIQDDGYQMLLHTVDALRIDVILIMGHDRLYSMVNSHFGKQPQHSSLKIIKLPRSGGVVSRDANFRRQSRSLATKRYFYGDTVAAAAANKNAGHRVAQLTPFLAHLSFGDATVYRLSSVALSKSLLPVAATQSTEPVQLTPIEINEQLQHSVLAVCHPTAVQRYQESGQARDLYQSGVAGFVVVERVLADTEVVHLLSPCAGTLPSHTLLAGDITWME